MSARKTLLLCSCDQSQTFSPEQLKIIAGAEQVLSVDNLCTDDMKLAAEHLSATNDIIIGCGQQTALFERLADEIQDETGHSASLYTIDLRDRAGWSAGDAKPARIHAKQAALLAAAQLPQAMAPIKTIESAGICCIVGPTDRAIAMAELLKDDLGVSCVVSDGGPIQLPSDAYDVARGQLSDASGALGGFELSFTNLETLNPAGRGALRPEAVQASAKSSCDVLIDLRGTQPAFPAHHKRNGYFWADPSLDGELERIALTARERVGTFEKTVYFKLETALCAHSRAKQSGCTRCLDVCPTEAIFSAGDFVEIDSNICAGCGSCAAVCPTQAVKMTETPFENLTRAMDTLAKTYRDQCGENPRLLLHTPAGEKAIQHNARYGDGLADDLIALGMEHVDGIGHAEMLAALAAGFSEVLILTDADTDSAALAPQLALAQAMIEGAGQARTRLQIVTAEQLSVAATHSSRTGDPVLLVGGRRDITRVAVAAMAPSDAAPIALPLGAPYGAINVNADACTLCLACVSLCPTGALGDHPERPEIQFTENACVQCGVCESTCPENAITLQPQLDLSKDALNHRALHGEEPFECIGCGVPFGVASTINRIVEKLEDKHWMFTNSDNVQLVKMCDNCRVKAQYHSENSPMAAGTRPRVRTTDDYLDS
ncbi:4Fe-4S dicluster domain-containing protein [Litorivicinus lipolyticus]|uniref:4Fe-4S dicluster domain-containing protein n=1 Tax=Litorivicinus lipolyticus TaxID=418701 RepID=A0A5Q2QAL3_9GAMM|nr:4Fe-4S binding protein [Litorivicinus lipolyticus]QGG79272.1 4Fe-4S dicluster domain-containing protein [Litorivicinus lipolyticus]